MQDDSYIMCFNATGELRAETLRLAQLHAHLGDWDAAREQAVADNLLQARKTGSSVQICRKLVFCLQGLSPAGLKLLREGTAPEQNQILWIAICRRYRLVAEFAIEVLRERFPRVGSPLKLTDFHSSYSRKVDWAPEVGQLPPVTRKKLHRMLFRMQRESGLISDNGSIQAAPLGERLCRVVGRTRPADLLYFPMFESDMARRA